MELVRKLKTISSLSLVFAAATSYIAPPPPRPDPIQQYRSLVDKIPVSVTAYLNGSPSLKKEIPISYKYLRDACPAMRKLDTKSLWDLSDWMNKKITPEEWSRTSYSFRMNSFRAVAVQKNSEVKIHLLGKLYNNIDFHPAFTVWMDDGKERFNQALHSDPYIQDAKKNWEWIAKKDSRLIKYTEHVGKLVVTSLLQDTAFNYPEVHISRTPVGYRGTFKPDSNSIILNLSHQPGAGLRTSYDVDRTTSHEFFHAVQLTIRNWFLAGKLEDNIPLKDAGGKFLYSFNGKLAHVADDINRDVYKNTFHERASFYFSDAAKAKEEMVLVSRTQAWIDNSSTTHDNRLPEAGVLPAACTIK